MACQCHSLERMQADPMYLSEKLIYSMPTISPTEKPMPRPGIERRLMQVSSQLGPAAHCGSESVLAHWAIETGHTGLSPFVKFYADTTESQPSTGTEKSARWI